MLSLDKKDRKKKEKIRENNPRVFLNFSFKYIPPIFFYILLSSALHTEPR